MKAFIFLLLIIIIFVGLSCGLESTRDQSGSEPGDFAGLGVAVAPEWSKNAVIYEVNLRQYTKEGTINAFREHLPRLRDLGIDILWFMPIHPIGEKNRKGEMGSPYSVADYSAINPYLGTEDDFRELVKDIHNLGMKVLLDWVPNHTAFDHPWTKSNPEWYVKDSLGNITHPKDTDWYDVADLNYDNTDMQAEMIRMLQLWVRDFDIDGYRCDVAGFVPNDFWAEAIDSLNTIKPVFMLAEWEDPGLHYHGFHMTYGWELHHIFNQVAQGKAHPDKIEEFLEKDMARHPVEAYRMNFTDNHDENSWNGTVRERLGDAADAMAVLAFTLQGMPLLYSGQEAGLDHRLAFFEKDEIDWSDLSKSDLFIKLISLKHRNQALWNGNHGAPAQRLNTSVSRIYAFTREKNGNKVLIICNLSPKPQKLSIGSNEDHEGIYTNIISGESKEFAEWLSSYDNMKAWDYLVLEKNQ